MNYRELDNLFLYEFLKNFAMSLIGIFIPVYILSEGMGLLPAALFLGGLATLAMAAQYLKDDTLN